jgi:DNA-binding CsgD family transcriptional regulator
MMQIAILVGDEGARITLGMGLGNMRSQIIHYASVGALVQSARPPDTLLIDLNHFALLREREPIACLRLSRGSRILLVLSLEDTLAAAPLLPFADAWIFTERLTLMTESLVRLGQEAYTVLPPQLLSRPGIDRMRLALLEGLTGAERGCLLALGKGLNNRDIGQLLDISEAAVKSLVRSMLHRLRFRNRTEAGVFAARNLESIAGPVLHAGADKGRLLH